MTTPDAVWKAPVTAAEEFDRLKAQSVGNTRAAMIEVAPARQ